MTKTEKKNYKKLLKNKEWLKIAISEVADRIIDYPESLLWC